MKTCKLKITQILTNKSCPPIVLYYREVCQLAWSNRQLKIPFKILPLLYPTNEVSTKSWNCDRTKLTQTHYSHCLDNTKITTFFYSTSSKTINYSWSQRVNMIHFTSSILTLSWEVADVNIWYLQACEVVMNQQLAYEPKSLPPPHSIERLKYWNVCLRGEGTFLMISVVLFCSLQQFSAY